MTAVCDRAVDQLDAVAVGLPDDLRDKIYPGAGRLILPAAPDIPLDSAAARGVLADFPPDGAVKAVCRGW
ncbi:MAG: hypothetical protein ACXVRI_04355, partial [Gaiellaceae bacterium]